MRLALLVTTASLIAFSAIIPALAASSDDAAISKFAKPVYDSSGKCVRTLWQEESDPCAPAAPPPTPVVAAPPPPTPAPLPVVSLEQRTIYFEFNKADLNLDAQAKLDQLIPIINKSSAIKDVVIHGFTDQIGSDSYNEALAQKRSLAVKQYIAARTPTKTTEGDIRGLGKSKPEEQCKAVKKRAERISCMNKERRVEIEFKATE